MALAFPGQSGPLWEIMARDAFLEVINDHAVKVRVLEREPSTLDETLKIACRLEALMRTESSDEFDDQGRRRDRWVRKVESAVPDVNYKDRVIELEALLREQRLEAERYRREAEINYSHANRGFTGPECSGSFGVVTGEYGTTYPPQPLQQPYGSRSGQDQSTFDRRGACFKCKSYGHWKNECPTRNRRANMVDLDRRFETYIDVNVEGKPAIFLLDTGCEHSLISRRMVAKANLTPTDLKICAANGTEIPVLGTIGLVFSVAGIPLTAHLLVSDAVEECMLGIDWMSDNGCQWDFLRKCITLRGCKIPLKSRDSRPCIRRVYVTREVVVPSRSQSDVPVAVSWPHLRQVSQWDCMLDSQTLQPGVFVARSLMPGTQAQAAVRVVNMSDKSVVLPRARLLGTAEPVIVYGEGMARAGSEGSLAGLGAGVAGAARTSAGLTGTHRPPGETARPRAGYAGPGRDRAGTDRPRPEGPTLLAGMQAGSTQLVSDLNGPEGESHVEPMLQSLPPDLTAEQRTAAQQFIIQNADVFSRSEYDLGLTHLVEHRINTGEQRPFRQPLRRHPLAHLAIIDQKVEEMLRARVIEPAASPFASNVLLARKADGSVRFCVDFRQLNQITYGDSYPLRRIDTCFDALGGNSYFSTIDLRSGFWQTPLDPRDADKTAFLTRKGQWRFRVLPMGLANSPSLFQRLMDLVLGGLTWDSCLCYVDDVIVFGKTFEQETERLQMVLQKFREAGLKLNPKKCRLFQRRVVFLGCTVSEAGIEPDPQKVSAVQNWPVPTNLTELRAFVGLSSYYRNWIAQFSELAEPLLQLTRKGERFRWGDPQQEAFDALKRALTTAPCLVSPKDEGDFVLDVDASNIALGAVLQQWQDGQLRVLGYASTALNRTQRDWCTTRKELFSVVFGLKRFKHYLLGRKAVVRSDHAALTYIRRSKELTPQQARWVEFIEQFDLTIVHRAGNKHCNADGLSRRTCEEGEDTPCKSCRPRGQKVLVGESDIFCGVVTRARAKEQAGSARNDSGGEELRGNGKTHTEDRNPPPRLSGCYQWSPEELQRLQQADPVIGQILSWVRLGDRPPFERMKPACPELKNYWRQMSSLTIRDGLLHRKFVDVHGEVLHYQLLVPKSIRHTLLQTIHEDVAGHLKFEKCVWHVRQRAYWHAWQADVRLFCKYCTACNAYHRGVAPRQGLLQSMEVGYPWERVHIDLTGPHVTAQGYNYIFTAIDAFTRFVVAAPIRHKTAKEVAKVLVDWVFCRMVYRCPFCLTAERNFRTS